MWEAVADRLPDAPAQRHAGSCGPGRSSTSAPTPSPPISWVGRRRAGQGRPVPLQRPRVPRVGVRRVQGRPGRGQHQLPLHARRTDLPVGQRRRRRRRVPRRLQRALRGRPRAPAADPHVAVGRRRLRAVPRLGDAVRSSDLRRGRVAPRRRGAARAITCCCSTPAARPACQGCDVAPGRPVPRPRPARAAAAGRRRPTSTTSPPQLDRPGPSSLPGGTADARHRPVQRLDDAVCRRVDRHPRRPPLRPRRTARHGRAGAGQVDDDRRRRLRPTDPAGPRRRARAAGTSRRCASSSRRA